MLFLNALIVAVVAGGFLAILSRRPRVMLFTVALVLGLLGYGVP